MLFTARAAPDLWLMAEKEKHGFILRPPGLCGLGSVCPSRGSYSRGDGAEEFARVAVAPAQVRRARGAGLGGGDGWWFLGRLTEPLAEQTA